MSVYELNCLYAAKALFLVFVVAPLLFMLGISLVYAVSQFLGSIWNAIILHHFPILRCRKCRYWATVQCPLYGHSTPDDAGGADCGGTRTRTRSRKFTAPSPWSTPTAARTDPPQP